MTHITDVIYYQIADLAMNQENNTVETYEVNGINFEVSSGSLADIPDVYVKDIESDWDEELFWDAFDNVMNGIYPNDYDENGYAIFDFEDEDEE